MLSKIVRFINSKKKTILEKTIADTIDILEEINKVYLKIFNKETLTILEDIKVKLEYLNDINYQDQDLNNLNGILIELIRKHIDMGKIAIKTDAKLYKNLSNYKNYVDKIMSDIKLE